MTVHVPRLCITACPQAVYNCACPQAVYNVERLEEEPVGTSILRVRANDLDQINTNNSVVAYSLTGTEARFFEINNRTGDISIAMILVRWTG